MKKIILLFAASALMVAIPAHAQTYQVNPDNTIVKWHGEKVTGEHNGKIQLKEGSFTVENNKITAGNFVIDMSTITNEDIEDKEYREKLIGHLKSDDFFGVEKYPTAKLNITGSTAFINDLATVSGNLTIKENTHPVEFEVSRKEGSYSADLTIDRSKYDVRYGSKSFFDGLGDKMIYDDFDINISVTVD